MNPAQKRMQWIARRIDRLNDVIKLKPNVHAYQQERGALQWAFCELADHVEEGWIQEKAAEYMKERQERNREHP